MRHGFRTVSLGRRRQRAATVKAMSEADLDDQAIFETARKIESAESRSVFVQQACRGDRGNTFFISRSTSRARSSCSMA